MAKGSRLQDFETKVEADLKSFKDFVEEPFVGPPAAPAGVTGDIGDRGPLGNTGPLAPAERAAAVGEGTSVSAEAAAAAQAEAATARRNVDIGATGAALADPLLAAPLVLQATRDEQEKGARVVAEREKDPDLKVIP
jgi:hypothetical protein